MFKMPISKIWIGILLLAILFAVTTIQSKLDEEPALSVKPETKVQTSEIPEHTELEEAGEEAAGTDPEEKAVSEDLRDTVSEVIDNALDIFTRSDLEIVAIGDSLTQGVGDETDNGGYVGILEDVLKESDKDVEIENYGKRGNRTDQLLKRMEKPEITTSLEEADVILITIGANDIMKVVKDNFADLEYKPFETERARYEARLRQIFDTMLELNPDAEIYLLGFYNPFESYFKDVEALTNIINNWNSTSLEVTREYTEVTYIPVQNLFQAEQDRYFAEDNFHPSHLGYQLMAERVFQYIRPSIKQSEDQSE